MSAYLRGGDGDREMATLDSVSEKLKLIGSKRNSLRNVILMLATEWKDLNEQLESTEESVRASVRELEGSVKSRVEELETREKEFLSFRETQIEEMKMKEKQLETMLRSANERIKEAELGEQRLIEEHESLEGLSEKLELEKEQLEHVEKAIGQRLEEILLKETYFEGRSRELDSIKNWIERRAKELDMKEEQVDDRVNELKLEEDLICKLNEERCKELELKAREIYSAQKLNEERSEKLDSKEKQLDAVQKYINESFKDFHSKSKQLKLDKKMFEERCKEIESKEKQLEEQCKEVELRQKQFVNTSVHSFVKVEQVEDLMPVDKAEIRFVVTMDGRNLQLFLNERSLDDESMSSEVYRVLQLSQDAAKLVLDAMEGFYPPHLKNGDVVFEEDVVRRSCIVLLEQLMKISPRIKPRLKEEAMKLAQEWKAKMRAVPANYLEVLGFLQLLASYKLASGFDADELLKLFSVVAEHNEAPDLCRVLGFTERVSGKAIKKEVAALDMVIHCGELHGVGSAKVDAVRPRESGTSTNGNRKRRRKLVVESSESNDTATRAHREEGIIQENGGSPAGPNSKVNGANHPWISFHKRPHVSYNESLGDVSPLRWNGLSRDSEEELKEGNSNNRVSRTGEPTGFTAVNRDKKGTKQGHVDTEGSLANRSGEVNGEATVMGCRDAGTSGIEGNDSESDSDFCCEPDPVVYECPDPEFNDFDKHREDKCFGVDQLWACYDTNDGMPRFYARIRKVLSPGFRLRITWLEPHLEDQDEINWFKGDLPIACGKFIHWGTEETTDHLTFSHQVQFENGSGRCSYLIYPRKGETWALFKDWAISWSFDPENHKKYEFEIVEVLSDFVRDDGIRVAYLDKVSGFVSVFQLTSREEIRSVLIPRTELLRFSHRVPSFKLMGAEREGISEGSFELDPASLGTISDEHGDVKMETEGLDVKADSSNNKSPGKGSENRD